jgi:hypothetical protein
MYFAALSNSIAVSTILELILSDTDELSSFTEVFISGETGNGFHDMPSPIFTVRCTTGSVSLKYFSSARDMHTKSTTRIAASSLSDISNSWQVLISYLFGTSLR